MHYVCTYMCCPQMTLKWPSDGLFPGPDMYVLRMYMSVYGLPMPTYDLQMTFRWPRNRFRCRSMSYESRNVTALMLRFEIHTPRKPSRIDAGPGPGAPGPEI